MKAGREVPQEGAWWPAGRLMLLQTALGAGVLLLTALWLQVPDASALDVIGSLALAALTIAVAGAGETSLVLRLGAQTPTRRSLALGTGFWLLAALVWWAWFDPMQHLGDNTYLYASYLNSKLPHGLRMVFSFGRLQRWMNWLWTTLAWSAGGVLAVPVIAVLLSNRRLRAVAGVFRSGWWWVALLIAVNVGVYGSAALLHWVPGHRLDVELLSLALRLVAVVGLDGVLVSGLLALTVRRMERASPPQAMPEGTPSTSQP